MSFLVQAAREAAGVRVAQVIGELAAQRGLVGVVGLDPSQDFGIERGSARFPRGADRADRFPDHGHGFHEMWSG